MKIKNIIKSLSAFFIFLFSSFASSAASWEKEYKSSAAAVPRTGDDVDILILSVTVMALVIILAVIIYTKRKMSEETEESEEKEETESKTENTSENSDKK